MLLTAAPPTCCKPAIALKPPVTDSTLYIANSLDPKPASDRRNSVLRYLAAAHPVLIAVRPTVPAVPQCVNEKFNPVVKIKSFFFACAGGFDT